MELRHLRYFQTVAEALSFSKAGRVLCVAQPALSRAVRELEEYLGVELFDRSRRQVRLTPAGESLWRETGLLFERLEETVRRVRGAARGEIGELRLGYIGPPTQGFLGGLLKEYRARHPGVNLIIEERTPERVWEMVSKGRLSIGLTRPVRSHEKLGLRSRLLLEETLCVAVPREHSLTSRKSLRWKELAGHPLVLLARREGAGSHDAILAACREAGFSPDIAQTPSLMGTILKYVEAGLGLGLVPASAAAEGAHVILVPLTPRRVLPLVLVWSQENPDPSAAAFRELVFRWHGEGRLR